MSLLRRALGREEARSDVSWGAGMVPMTHSWAGSIGAVSTDQAMRLSAVFACLRLLSEGISTLPLDTFRRGGRGRQPYQMPGYLRFLPPQQSRIDTLSQIVLSLLTDGNAYMLTPRNNLGVPVDLVVLDPGAVTTSLRQAKVHHEVLGHDLGPLELVHIRGMCLPGRVTGVSPIRYAAESIELGLNAQRYGASFFANGALPGAVIEATGDFSKESAERWRETWNASHRGVDNANKMGVLTHGAKLSAVSVNSKDAQFLETRQFQVPDIARIFGVPPHLIADASNSTSWGSGLAEQNLAFGQFSLRPWITRIEDGLDRLLYSHGAGKAYTKLNLDALLRASLKDRYEAYKIGIDSGFLGIDEARETEDLPSLAQPNPPPPDPAPEPGGTT